MKTIWTKIINLLNSLLLWFTNVVKKWFTKSIIFNYKASYVFIIIYRDNPQKLKHLSIPRINESSLSNSHSDFPDTNSCQNDDDWSQCQHETNHDTGEISRKHCEDNDENASIRIALYKFQYFGTIVCVHSQAKLTYFFFFFIVKIFLQLTRWNKNRRNISYKIFSRIWN